MIDREPQALEMRFRGFVTPRSSIRHLVHSRNNAAQVAKQRDK